MGDFIKFPPQQMSYKKKTDKWRKQHLDWATNKTFFNYSLVRKSTIHKKINYDLVNGILHMPDVELILNPDNIQAGFIPDKIQHYPLINSKLNVLRGEESKRIYDYKVVVTNPNSVNEISENKKQEVLAALQAEIENTSQDENTFNNNIQKLNQYYNYTWQDIREVRANYLLNHYNKELNFNLLFNNGFMDALTIAEEIYKCDIIGGEPTIERVNPLKLRAFKQGYSNKIEDADIIIIEDYWSPSKIIDTFYADLTTKDREYLENLPDNISDGAKDEMDNIDERHGFINANMIGEEMSTDSFYFDPTNLFTDGSNGNLLPYDLAGNVRVLQMYWKSRRKIKEVKSIDPISGEEVYTFYPEDYVLNTDYGEEEKIFYINEAWEGTKIGESIYVNMRPRLIQYNKLSNPSKCHFGIIGTVYNLNESKPYSFVDMMKPYNYLYDVVHDRLNKLIAKNWGKIISLDLAKVPKGWNIDKWLYYAKVNSIAVVDSFKEGNTGMATGKLAGALNNASSGVIDAEMGNIIQQEINLLEYIKNEMSEVVGITKQREGQISNRETVGGVERATLQSSYITEWVFLQHDDTKKRTLECFLETAKIALKGRNKKFNYILPDYTSVLVDIDGDEFAENDYGLVVDANNGTQELNQKLDTLAQAALQNQAINFSTVMKLYNTCSMAEKQRMIENAEQELQQRQEQQQQQAMQAQQEQLQQQLQLKQAEMELKDSLNQRDNETKIMVAQITHDGVNEAENSQEELMEKMRQFDETMNFNREKLKFDKTKHSEDNALKDKISLRQSKNKVTK